MYTSIGVHIKPTAELALTSCIEVWPLGNNNNVALASKRLYILYVEL